MKHYILLALVPSLALANPCDELSQQQLGVLHSSYEAGKQYDLGETMATIALKESSAGKHLINPFTGDYGVYQGNYKTICNQAKVKGIACSMEVQRVVDDIKIAQEHALETLLYWKKYYDSRISVNNYQMMIRSYHSGFSPFSKDADAYWEKFRVDYKVIKKCIK